jgi:hypothetical protein
MPRPSASDKLVAAAVDTFHTRGYKACTIEEIADRAARAQMEQPEQALSTSLPQTARPRELTG